MIVRDLLIKLGFQANTTGVDVADRKVKGLTGSSVALGTALGNVAAQMARAGFQALAAELQQSVDASMSFGKAMGNVSSLIGGNQARTLELAGAAKQLAVEFGRTSADITGGMYEVISTFGDTKDAIAQTAMAIKVGAAGAGTTADGLALLGAVTKAYGDTSATAMQKVADLGFQTVNLGKVSLPELASSIGQATPLASALGIKLEELFAVQATLSGVTGSGAEVFTQMGSAMKSLTERSPEMAKAFKKAFGKEGIKTAQEAIGKHGFVGTLQAVIAQTDGTQEAIGKLFGRIEGLKLGLALTGSQAGDFKDKMQAMKNSAGATDIAFAAQTSGLAKQAHAMEILNARGEAMDQMLGDKLAATLVNAKGGWLDFKGSAIDVLADAFDNATAAADRFKDASGAPSASPVGGFMGRMGVFATMMGDIGLTGLSHVGSAAKSMTGNTTADEDADIKRDAAMFRARLAAYRLSIASPEAAAMVGENRRNREGFDAEDAAMVAKHGGTARQAWAAQRWNDDAPSRLNDMRARGYAAQHYGERLTAGKGSGLASILTSMGTVNVNVTVPHGTEAAAAARIGSTGARVMLDQIVEGAKRAFVDHRPGAEG